MKLRKTKETKVYNYKDSDIAPVKDDEVTWEYDAEKQLYICTDKFYPTMGSGHTKQEALEVIAFWRHRSLMELDEDHKPDAVIVHETDKSDIEPHLL